MTKIAICTDADSSRGYGHLMRCLALAQGIRAEGGEPVMLLSPSSQPFEKLIRQHKFAIEYIPADTNPVTHLLQKSSTRNASWIVFDDYRIPRAVIDSACRELLTLQLDDIGFATPSSSHLVLNHNPYAVPSLYPHIAPEKLLLGRSYTLLRHRIPSDVQPLKSKVERILVTLGGADHREILCRLIDYLDKLDQITRFDVVLPSISSLPPSYRRTLEQRGRWNILSGSYSLFPFFAQSDLVICGLGSTVYELCFLGIPFGGIRLSENQSRIAEWVDREGCGAVLGSAEAIERDSFLQVVGSLLCPEARRAQQDAQLGIFDGAGSRRVAAELLHQGQFLRNATKADMRLLWNWANDPLTREMAFDSTPISWETHRSWFCEKLLDECCAIYVFELHAQPVGQIRFEIQNDTGILSYALSKEARGKGLGLELLERGVRRFFHEHEHIQEVKGYVLHSNHASRRSLSHAGFVCSDPDVPLPKQGVMFRLMRKK